MTNGSNYLLDTSVVVFLMRGNEEIQQRMIGINVIVSSITAGELYFGAKRAQDIAAGMQKVSEFLARCAVVVCDEATAVYYAELKDYLRRRGTPIPENDLWIAATALQHDLILATRGQHFSQIAALTVEQW